LQHDQSRAAALKTVGRDTFDRRTDIIAVTNNVVSYIAAVGVGSPATTCVFCSKLTLGKHAAANVLLQTT
jgi:hypothetical protein